MKRQLIVHYGTENKSVPQGYLTTPEINAFISAMRSEPEVQPVHVEETEGAAWVYLNYKPVNH